MYISLELLSVWLYVLPLVGLRFKIWQKIYLSMLDLGDRDSGRYSVFTHWKFKQLLPFFTYYYIQASIVLTVMHIPKANISSPIKSINRLVSMKMLNSARKILTRRIRRRRLMYEFGKDVGFKNLKVRLLDYGVIINFTALIKKGLHIFPVQLNILDKRPATGTKFLKRCPLCFFKYRDPMLQIRRLGLKPFFLKKRAIVKKFPLFFLFYFMLGCLYIIFLNFCFGPIFWFFKYGGQIYWMTVPFYFTAGLFINTSIIFILILFISLISFLIHLYAYGYLNTDAQLGRFLITFFSFFTAMFFFVGSSNVFAMFVAWELLGLSSFFLIKFWNARSLACRSAAKALIINRIGDFFLLSLVSLLYTTYFTTDISTILVLTQISFLSKVNLVTSSLSLLTVFGAFAAIAACVKSAQFPFHTWLPDAMEGPTPVSGLLHAATMVTAGIILIVKFSGLVELVFFIKHVLLVIGAITALLGSFIAFGQYDIKKIIAYSTCSQLGYMFVACGLSYYELAVFHLLTHAFFKALLFLGAGIIIHAINDEQDIRKMGSLGPLLLLSFFSFMVGSFALMGLPPFSGFFSKDLIIEMAFVFPGATLIKSIAYFLITLAAFFTIFYSIRLFYFVYISPLNGSRVLLSLIHNQSRLLLFPVFALLVFSIIIGYLLKDFIFGFSSNFSALFTHIYSYPFDREYINITIKLFIPVFAIILILFIFLVPIKKRAVSATNFNFSVPIFCYKPIAGLLYLKKYVSEKWYMDVIYNSFILRPVSYFSIKFTFESLDKGIFEYFGPRGFANLIYIIANKIIYAFQSGYIRYYVNNIYLIFIIFALSLACNIDINDFLNNLYNILLSGLALASMAITYCSGLLVQFFCVEVIAKTFLVLNEVLVKVICNIYYFLASISIPVYVKYSMLVTKPIYIKLLYACNWIITEILSAILHVVLEIYMTALYLVLVVPTLEFNVIVTKPIYIKLLYIFYWILYKTALAFVATLHSIFTLSAAKYSMLVTKSTYIKLLYCAEKMIHDIIIWFSTLPTVKYSMLVTKPIYIKLLYIFYWIITEILSAILHGVSAFFSCIILPALKQPPYVTTKPMLIKLCFILYKIIYILILKIINPLIIIMTLKFNVIVTKPIYIKLLYMLKIFLGKLYIFFKDVLLALCCFILISACTMFWVWVKKFKQR